MSKVDKTEYEAKESLKLHIKFLESLLKNINKDNLPIKGGAILTAWCINQYMTYTLKDDINNAIARNEEIEINLDK